MKTPPLGYLQRQMINFMRKHKNLASCHWFFHLHDDRESQRIANSLERRGIICIDKSYTMWLIKPNYAHVAFN
jgi:hypothetical protein